MKVATIESAAIARFEALGGQRINPPTLLPISIPLELSGEAVRSRLVSCSGANGSEYVLRPDLTLAIAAYAVSELDELEPQLIRYSDRAYRLPAVADDPIEFIQTGFERYCDPNSNPAADDVETIETVLNAVSDSGVQSAEVHLGDLGLFSDLVDALELDEDWAKQAKAAFRHPDGINGWLKRVDEPGSADALASALFDLTDEESEDFVRAIFKTGGVRPVGSRSLREIAAGLKAKSIQASSNGIADNQRSFLSSVFQLRAVPAEVPERIQALAAPLEINVDGALEAFAQRNDAIANRAPPFWTTAMFQCDFGRRFNYYDGFVFEVVHPSLLQKQPLAAGGRYDGLLSALAQRSVNLRATGGVVRPDRIFRALVKEPTS